MGFRLSDNKNIIQGHDRINDFLGVGRRNCPDLRELVVYCSKQPLICGKIFIELIELRKDLKHWGILQTLAEG